MRLQIVSIFRKMHLYSEIGIIILYLCKESERQDKKYFQSSRLRKKLYEWQRKVDKWLLRRKIIDIEVKMRPTLIGQQQLLNVIMRLPS